LEGQSEFAGQFAGAQTQQVLGGGGGGGGLAWFARRASQRVSKQQHAHNEISEQLVLSSSCLRLEANVGRYFTRRRASLFGRGWTFIFGSPPASRPVSLVRQRRRRRHYWKKRKVVHIAQFCAERAAGQEESRVESSRAEQR